MVKKVSDKGKKEVVEWEKGKRGCVVPVVRSVDAELAKPCWG